MRFPPRATLLPPFIALLVLTTATASARPANKPPKPPKVHTAILGSPHRVTWLSATSLSPSSSSASDPNSASTPAAATHLALTIRPLLIDGRRKELTTGPAHDITDHTFAVLQVLHINDALPTDKSAHFIYQTGAWLLIDRTTGHVTPLKIPAYDAALTGISWYRDLAAYCSVSASGKTLSAEVFEIGSRKAAARKRIATWPLPPLPASIAPDSNTPSQNSNSASPSANVVSPNSSEPRSNPLAPAVHPRRAIPSVAAREQQQETGLPHPALCNSFEWQRDPLRVVITARADRPPVALDIGAGSAPAPSKRSRKSDDDSDTTDADTPDAAPAANPPTSSPLPATSPATTPTPTTAPAPAPNPSAPTSTPADSPAASPPPPQSRS